MTKFIIGGLAAFAMVAVPAAVPALAHADSRDDHFLAAVSSQGISGQPDQLIAYAHTMCDVMGTPAALGPMTNLMATQGLAPAQVSNVAFDGVRAYCPEKSGLIPPMFAPPG